MPCRGAGLVMKIRRSRPAGNFTILPNATLRDDRLTRFPR